MDQLKWTAEYKYYQTTGRIITLKNINKNENKYNTLEKWQKRNKKGTVTSRIVTLS
jgi:hypothetical protein